MPKVKAVKGRLIFTKVPPGAALGGALFAFLGLAMLIATIYEISSGRGIKIDGKVVHEGGQLMLPIGLPAFAVALGLGIVLRSTVARYEADHLGISEFNMLGFRILRIRWADVVSFYKEPRNEPILRSAKSFMSFGEKTHLWPMLCMEVIKRIPAEAEVEGELPFKRELTGRLHGVRMRIFRMGNPSMAFAGLICIVFCIAGAIMSANSPGMGIGLGRMVVACFIIAFFSLGCFLIATAVLRRVEVRELGLVVFDIFGQRSDRILWENVEGFEKLYSDRGVQNYVLWAGPTYMHFDSQMDGFEEFCRIVESKIGVKPGATDKPKWKRVP